MVLPSGTFVGSSSGFSDPIETISAEAPLQGPPQKLIAGRTTMEHNTPTTKGTTTAGTIHALFTRAGIHRFALLLVVAMGLVAAAVGQVTVPYLATGSFTPPTGVTSVTVECWGGGGHGSTQSSNGQGGGGGGGAYARSTLTVVPGTPYTVTVGAGSTSVAAGGDSWFNTAGTILAKGGSSVANNTAAGAAGGTAAASIGTTKFSGGAGATSTTNSGGGGSSAGTAATGANGAVTAGGNAPAGGGNGGDGQTGSSDGGDGSFPGGAGGGAKRNGGFFTRNGGNGGDGYVVVSYTYASGTCLNAVTGTGIADNTCGTSSFTVTIPVSGQPTTLGTAAGNARLNSLGLIISHTFNADLDITLTSPTGTTRNLILDRFGNGDNIGNPGSCPGSALILQDGGTALTNTNTSNVTGTYAPEQTLAAFTGNPNGNWILTICDDANVDVGNFRYFSMDFCTVPSTATVGSAQTICTGGTTLALGGNTPAFGTGAWSVVSGGAGTFSNAASGSSTFTHTSGTGPVVLRWTISSGTCASTSATVSVTISQPPTTATVGGAQTICANGTTLALGGNTPSVGTGAWSIVSGGPGTFSNAASGSSTFTQTGGGAGPVVLRWTISNNPCTASTANVTITINQPPTTASVGGAQTICASGTTLALGGNTPSVGTGAWSVVSGGAGTFSNAASGSSTFTHTSGTGPVVLRWTISNSPCTASTANVSITITQSPTTANAGTNQTICAVAGSATMAANTASVGTGAWSQVSGPVTATIGTASSPTTGITAMTTAGTYVFRWTISNNPCPASTSDVTIVSNGSPTAANAGSTQNICIAPGSTTMAANTPSVGTGAWSQVSGPVTATIADATLPNTGISGLTTVGSYVFRWTISNNPCTASQSNVTINVSALPTTAAAGTDQTVCTSVGTITMAANTPAVGTGAWSQVSGPSAASIVTASSPTTVINGLTTVGTFVFRWTISNGACTASTSDMNVVVSGVPTTANAGPAQTICANPGSATMAANTPSVGAGNWTQLSGPLTATITTASSPSTTITGMTTAGSYVFRWTISNNPCISSQNSVTITVSPEPTVADAGVDQSACVSPGTTTMAANTPGVGIGAWSQISGPLTASIADSNDPVTGVSGFNTAGTYVFRWTISITGCTASTDDVSIVVSGSPTTASAGGDQNVCSTFGNATMAANTPGVGTGAWTQIAGPVTATITNAASPTTTITGMTTTGTYTFRWSITNGGCSPSEDDVDMISGGCTYYSQATGDISDPIWNLAPVGAPGFASFSAPVNMVVQNSHVVTNTAVTAVGTVAVNAGGTLLLSNGTSFQVNGASATFNGTLTTNDNSELELASASATTLTLAATTSFYVLTVNTAAGTTVTGTAQIRGTLNLQDGVFNCTGNPVVLRSTATYTGRLGPVAATASYTGNMRIERYIPAGATNWRLMGSSIMSRKVNHWMDDFTTAGFPGSHVPFFDSPVGSGILWPSVRWYDETNTGTGQNDGMTGASSNNQSLAIGQGFATWSGTGLTTTTAFTVDLENQSPVIASSPVSLPMTYTNTGNPGVDGWNLVSNPVPSPIAFDQIVRGADVADYITYFNPTTGNTATYDISSGISVNGGTNIIQSSQGFFLKASGAAATATVDESAKVASNNGGFFGGLTEDGPAVMHLTINSGMNTYSDETIVVFSQGSPAFDTEDVPKYIFGHPEAPQIATMGPAAELIAINAYGAYSNAISIPIMVDAGVSGTYTVTATGAEDMGLSCLSIEDLQTGMITPLNEGSSYSFDMLAEADATAPRLMLHATAPLNFITNNATCFGSVNGSATVEVVGGTSDVTWMNDMGGTIAMQTEVSGLADVQDLAAGDYQVTLTGIGGCAMLTHNFSIDEPAVLDATGSTTDASCPSTADGSVALSVTGGTAPYGILWSNNSIDANLVAGAGTYDAVITDANGCEINTDPYTIVAGSGPNAAADADVLTVQVNLPVTFVNNSTLGAEYLWDFADGNTSTEAAPQHSFALPGVYVVTLTVTDGLCTATTTITITVETSTGIEEASTVSMTAWMNGDDLVVEHGFADKYPVQLDVLNEAGQVFIQHKVAGPAGRFTIPASELASGIWYVRVSNDQVRKTIPVVIVR